MVGPVVAMVATGEVLEAHLTVEDQVGRAGIVGALEDMVEAEVTGNENTNLFMVRIFLY